MSQELFIVKTEFEIYKYFFFISFMREIFDAVWCVQLVPTILFTSCLQNFNWLVVNLAAAVDCPQLVPKYHSKVLVYLSKLPNLFVYIDNMFSLQEEFMRHVYWHNFCRLQ